MKTSGKFCALLFCAAASQFFWGCDNFMNGGELKDEIETKIDYASAPYVKAVVQKADVDDNGVRVHSFQPRLSSVKIAINQFN